VIGKKIAHYKILEKIGEGGMGIVFKAKDLALNREIALKLLPISLNNDPEARNRFILETQAASALDHPNICAIYDIKETDDGQLYIVMAHYRGATLKQIIEEKKQDTKKTLIIVLQILKGLALAHRMGIIHRNIKPANIILTVNNEVKILDFGLARFTRGSELSEDSWTLDRVAYMSPEQVSGDLLDFRTDIWSLGCVFYELLCGRTPFSGDYPQAVLYAILNEDYLPLSELLDYSFPELDQIINRLLQKNRDNRYQSINHIIKDLDILKNSEGFSRF